VYYVFLTISQRAAGDLMDGGRRGMAPARSTKETEDLAHGLLASGALRDRIPSSRGFMVFDVMTQRDCRAVGADGRI
jgi:hypothetical protein